MGNILRRVTAFLLGIIFTVTSLVGGVVGGAYYAYKNFSPISGLVDDAETQKALGELYDATIEEWSDLIANAMNPDENGEYTFARLAEEYGVDLAKLLEQMGLDVSEIDQTSDDWKALEGVSLLSILAGDGGMEKVLDSVKLKALYVLSPAILGGPIDDYLSPEAQSALGDYSIAELLAADEATGELGIVQAIKGLKIGSFLPEIFDATFDVKTNEYIYTVKEDGALKDFTFLNLVASVPLQGIFNIVEGGDVMTELFEGEFKSITSTPISEILGMFADVAGEETASVIRKYTQVFGDVTVRDLFVKGEEGYTFAYENLLSGLELGYLVGYTKVDGKWVDEDGEPATGLLGLVASISVGDILENKGDVVGMINAAVGDLSIKTIYETIVEPDEDGNYPVIIERLGTVKVSDILGGGVENIKFNLKVSLKNAFEGATLRDVTELLGEDLQTKLEDIPVVDALLNIRIDSFIREEYTAQDIIQIFDDAVGDFTIGQLSENEDADGALGLLMDYKLGYLFDGVIAILDGGKASEIADGFIGEYRVGDIFGALLGYTENAGSWQKDGRYIAEGLVPLMQMSVAKFACLFEEEPEFDVMGVVGEIQIADVAYTTLQVLGINDILEKETVNGKVTYLVGGDYQDFAALSKVVLTLTVNDLINNAANGEFWLDRARQIKLGDLTAYVINKVLDIEVELVYNNGEWRAITDYLDTLMTNVFNTSVGGIIDAVTSGDVELIKQKVTAKLGDTNVGDIAYAALGLAGVKDVVVTSTHACGYEMGQGYTDLNNLAQAVFGLSVNNIINNATDVDWWFENLGSVKIGDALGFVINKFAPSDMTAVLADNNWTVNGKMGAVLTSLFNIKVSDLRDPDAAQLLKDTFGDIRIGDVCEDFIPDDNTLLKNNNFIKHVFDITVNNIIDMVNSESMSALVFQLQDLFAGKNGERDVQLRDVVELINVINVEDYDYGVFGRILDTDFVFLFGLLNTADIKGEILNEYGDVSLGEVVYTALKVAGIDNIVTESNGAYFATGEFEDFESLSRKLLSPTLDEVMNNLNAEYWINRAYEINLGDLTAYVVNKLVHAQVELIYNDGSWVVNSDYIADLIANVANTTIGGIVNTVTSGDVELIKQKVTAKLGDTNVGDIAYAVCGLAKLSGYIGTSNSDCGYELASEYEELNTLAQAVMVLKLADIVNNAASKDYWLGAFEEITVGDVADFFLPDDMEENGFMLAVRNVSVSDIVKIVNAETTAQRVLYIQDLFDGVQLAHIASLAGLADPENEALKKVLDTELVFLIGLASAKDIVGEIGYEFKDITLNDAIGTLVKDLVDTTNPFIDATLNINVQDITDIIGAQNASDVYDTIYNIYTGVTIGDAVTAFYDGEIPGDAIDKVYALYLNDILQSVQNKRVVEFLYEQFGDVALADIVFEGSKLYTIGAYNIEKPSDVWTAQSASGNLDTLVANVLNTTLGTIYNNIENQDNLKNDIVKILGDTTFGEIVALAYDNAAGIGVLTKLCNVKIADVVSNAFEGTILDFAKDFAFTITLDDLVGFILPTEIRENAFIAATLKIDTNTVLDILNKDGLHAQLVTASYVYENVTIGDIAALADLDKLSLSVLEAVFKARIDDIIISIANNDIVDFTLSIVGGISVGNVMDDVETLVNASIIPDSIEGNNLIQAVLAVTVNDVYGIVTNGKVLNDIGTLLQGVTVGDVVDLILGRTSSDTDTQVMTLAAAEEETSNGSALDTLYTIDIGDTLIGIANNDMDELTDKLTTAFGQLPSYVKYPVYAAAGIAIGVLYFVDNPLLCELSNKYLGEGKTWGELLGETLGYTKGEDGKYVNSIGYNGLMDTLLSETITTTLTTGYPLLNNIKDTLTLGNVLTATDSLATVIENALGMNFVATQRGVAFEGDFYALSDAALNLALGEFLEEYKVENGNATLVIATAKTRKEALYNAFGSINIGDITAYVVNNLSARIELIDNNGDWVVNSDYLSDLLENIVNTSIWNTVETLTSGNYALIEDKFTEKLGDTNVGDILYAVLGFAGVKDVIIADDSECGYGLLNNYEAFNTLVRTVLGIKLADLINKAAEKDYWLDVFGNVTVGNLVDYFIESNDELMNNKFMTAVRNVSVYGIEKIVNAETKEQQVTYIQDMFTGVKVSDITDMVGLTEVNNDALKNILDTDVNFIIGLFVAKDVLTEVGNEYKDVTLKAAVGTYLEKTSLDLENAFIAATLNFGVADIVSLIKAENADAIYEVVYNLYGAVTLGNTVEAFYKGTFASEAIDKVYALYLNDIIKAVRGNRILDFLYEKFNDVALGELVFDKNNSYTINGYTIVYAKDSWTVTSANGGLDEVLCNVLNLTLGKLHNDAQSIESLKTNLVKVFGETTVGNVGELVYANDLGIGLLGKVYDVKIADILSNAFDGTFASFGKDFLLGITLDDLVGFVMSDSVKENAFVKASLTISGKTIYDAVDGSAGENAILETAANVYNGVTFGNILALADLEKAPLSILEPVFNARVDELLLAIGDNEIGDYVLNTVGKISVANVLADIEGTANADILPDSIEENALIKAVLDITISDVYAIIVNGTVLNDIGTILDGVTVGDVASLFVSTNTSFDSLQTVYSIDIGKLLIGIANNDLTELTDKLTTAFNQLPDVVKYSVYAAAGITVGVLYFANNELLCELSDKYLGEGKTWGELLGETLGYAKGDDGKYVNDIGYNGLMDTLLSETITETITTGYPLLNTIKDTLTLGNVLTATDSLATVIENALGMNFVATQRGVAFEGDFYALSDAALNLALGEFLEEYNVENGKVTIVVPTAEVRHLALYNAFEKVNIGDVTAYFFNRYAKNGATATNANGTWTVKSELMSEVLTNAMNITAGGIYRALQANDKAYYIDKAKVLFGDTNVGDIVYAIVKTTGIRGFMEVSVDECGYTLTSEYHDFNKVAQRFFGVTLVEIVENLSNGAHWRTVFGDLTIGDFVNHFVSEELQANKFINTTTSVTASTVYDLTKSTDMVTLVNALSEIYDGVTIYDVISIFANLDAPTELVKTVFSLEMSDIALAIMDGRVGSYLYDTFGATTIADLVINTDNAYSMSGYTICFSKGAWKVESDNGKLNELLTNVSNITLAKIYDNIKNQDNLEKDIAEVLGSTTVGEIASLAYDNSQNIGAVTRIYNVKLTSIVNSLFRGTTLTLCKDLLFDITLHDLVGFMLSDEVRENTFVKATMSVNTNTVISIVNVGSTQAVINNIADLYTGVKVADIMKLAKVDTAPVVVLEPVFEANIEALLRAIADNNVKDYVLTTLGEVNVGDVAYSVFQVANISGVMEQSAEKASGYALATKYNEFDRIAQKAFGISLDNIMNNGKERKFWVDLVRDVTIGDVANYFIPDSLEMKKFIAAVTSISAQNVNNIVKAGDLKAIVKELQTIFEGVELHDVFGYDTADALSYDLVTKIFDTDVNFLLDLVVAEDRLTAIRAEFKDITLGDALSKFRTSENAFVKATYSFSVDTAFEMLDADSKVDALKVVAKLYEGVTAQDALSIVTDYTTSRESVNAALKLDLGLAASAVLNKQGAYLRTYAKSVYNVTTKKEKLLIGGVAGVGAVALHFVNNELLCKLIDKVLGADATWGDILADGFGYTLTADGYTMDGLHNNLMNTFLSEKITATFQDGYPFGSTFKPLLTVGNLVTIHPVMIKALGKLGLTLVEDDSQNLMVSGNLANITKSVFTLGVNDFITAENGLASMSDIKTVLYRTFNANVFGDVLAVVINKQSFVNMTASYNGSEWVVVGKAGSFISRCLNVSFGEAWDLVKNRNYSVISDVIGDITLYDAVSLATDRFDSNATAKLVLSLKLKDVIQIARGKTSVGSVVGGWTLEELAGDYLPARIDKTSAFAAEVLGMTLSEVNAMRKGNVKTQVLDKFGEYTFAEMLEAIKYDVASADALVADILQLKLNIFDGGMNAGIDAIMDSVKAKKIGVFLEYDYDEVNDVWTNGGKKVTGIMATLADMSIKQITDDPDFFNNLTLGEALGYEQLGSVWLDENGDEVEGIMAAFADVKIGSLDEATLKTKINDIKLSDVMTIDGSSHSVLVALKDTKIGELSTAMNTIKLGDVITIDANSAKVLQTLKDEEIGTIATAFDNLTLGDVIDIDTNSAKALQSLKGKKINELSTAFNDLTIGDVVETKDNTILKALEKTTITNMSTEINDMYIGTIMGYEKVGDNWQKDGTTATGISRVLVTYQVKDLTDAKFADNLVGKLTVGDVFPDAGSDKAGVDALIKFIEPEWKINELGTQLSKKFNSDKFTVQTAIDLGIFGTLLNDGEVADGCYGALITGVYGSDAWKKMSVSKFIEYILIKAFVNNAYTPTT